MSVVFFRDLDAEGWGNVIQAVLLLVTVFGLGTALHNGRKDRLAATRIAAADRYAADERGADDRREADRRAESDRAHAREQAQQQLRLQQSIRLVQLIHGGRPTRPTEQTPWAIEIRSLLYALGEDDLPSTWRLFTGNAAELSDAEITPTITAAVKKETADLASRAGKSLHCPSCFHNH